MKRRDFMKTGLAAGVTAATGGACASAATSAGASASPAGTQEFAAGYALSPAGAASDSGIKHSVCKWCFPKLSLDELAAAAQKLGMHSIELLGPDDWPTLKKYGLTCAMSSQPAGSIAQGWNRVENHAMLLPAYRKRLEEAAAAGIPSVIAFSGNRDGMDDQQGLENCARGLVQLMPDAERLGVNVVMELLNSKVNHPDYMCDHTAWGVALAKRVSSERFKLLYDIYHMQIMEGDVIRTIRDNHQYIGHYHTAGNPGRHEIDGSQELYYPAIVRAIEETGFQGYLAQEFIPTRDPLASLAEAVRICRV